ncbi:MAG: hypoxanthine phosphoribosyltransferase [Bacteroidales bacterium OttesenSCG-928-I14]|jgi:hypoxanthine phosphoribosyltransferase|nr:hypoxanthine phosphoribosyltransferase [Bacteroidales bacterium OttesenSCG-928-I14]
MKRILIKDKWFELLINENDLIEKINEVAKQVNKDLKNKTPLFICVLKGAFMFASELIGRFDHQCEIDFINIKSYEGMNRMNVINKTQNLTTKSIENRHIVIIEDVIDTGHTINYIINILKKMNPASIKIATLLFKPCSVQFNIGSIYIIKEISNNFVVGFGSDYNGYGRNYRNIYQIKI